MKAVPLAEKEGKPFIEATDENALAGTYPLSRFLFVYINKHPSKPLQPLEREFVKMVLSKTGQGVVIKDGYIPLPASVAEKYLTLLK